jgi:amidase
VGEVLQIADGGDATRARIHWATGRSVKDGAVLCLPAAASIAPPVGLAGEASNAFRERTLSLTCIANLARLPQVTVIGGRVENCPIGLGLIARRGSDRQLLALAEKIVVGRG